MSADEFGFDDEFVAAEETSEGEVTAAPSSGLAGLRAQREQIKAALHIDLAVPRYENIYVRLTPFSQAQIKRITKRAEQAKDDSLADALVIAQCAVGVFSKGADGKPEGDPAQWPKFDKDLAEQLGEPHLTRATDVVRALYVTEGDMRSAVAALTKFSGYAEEQVAEEYEGN